MKSVGKKLNEWHVDRKTLAMLDENTRMPIHIRWVWVSSCLAPPLPLLVPPWWTCHKVHNLKKIKLGMVIKDGGRQQMYVCKLVVFNYYTWGKDQCDLKRFRKRMCKPCVSWRGPLYWFKVFNLIIRTQRTSLVLLQEVSNHPPSPHPLTKPNNQTHYSVTWDVNSMLHLHKLGKKYASRLLCSRALCIGSNFAFLYIYIFKRKQCKALVMLEEVSNSPPPNLPKPNSQMSFLYVTWAPIVNSMLCWYQLGKGLTTNFFMEGPIIVGN